jgi:hypothetical protein
MKHEPIGAERREAERAVLKEIAETVVTKIEHTAEKCPECGSTDYHHMDGCEVCLSCGFTPCGAHF